MFTRRFQTSSILHSMRNTKYVRLEPFFDIGNFGVQEIASGGAAVRAVVCEWCVQNVCSSADKVSSMPLKCMGTVASA